MKRLPRCDWSGQQRQEKRRFTHHNPPHVSHIPKRLLNVITTDCWCDLQVLHQLDQHTGDQAEVSLLQDGRGHTAENANC